LQEIGSTSNDGAAGPL